MKTQISKQHANVVAVQFQTTFHKEARMKQHSILSRLWFVAALVLCFSICGVARADNTVPFYTGSWGAYGPGDSWNPGDTTVVGEMQYISTTLNFVFDFSAPISNFQKTGDCSVSCYFTGNINSGTVSFDGHDNFEQHPPYDFTGSILSGGTFSAWETCDPINCDWQSTVTFDFRSQASDGWLSTGDLQFISGCADSQNDCEWNGTLSQHTFAPEPGSLILFGSGIAGLTGVLRRRLIR
jgi:hypothetical protein